MNGKGAEVPFQGNQAAFQAKFSPVSSRKLGRISIHAALHSAECGAKVVNIMDQDESTSSDFIWPTITASFGLKGTGPATDQIAQKPSQFIANHSCKFRKL
jgi:hypothetical protein